MSVPMNLLSVVGLVLLADVARAGSGHLAIGGSTASAFSPSEPRWQGAGGAALGCVGLDGWLITGGHDWAGPRGEVLRTADDVRWGVQADLCRSSGAGWLGSAGIAYGQQHGTTMYATPQIAAGVAAFAKRGPDGSEVASFSPYLQPKVALGVALPPGVSVELGPYLMIAPSVVRLVHGTMPAGSFIGQVGVELTVLAGAASPSRPWRR